MTYHNSLFVAELESLSPVHTDDKVEFNTVDFVESRQSRPYRQQSRPRFVEIVAGFSNSRRVCTGL